MKITENFKEAANHTIESVKIVVEDPKTIKNICKIVTKSLELAKQTGIRAGLTTKYFSTTNTVLDSFGIASALHYFSNETWKRDHWTRVVSMVSVVALSALNTMKLGAKLAFYTTAGIARTLGRTPLIGRVFSLPLEGSMASLALVISSFSLADNAIKLNRLNHPNVDFRAKITKWEGKSKNIPLNGKIDETIKRHSAKIQKWTKVKAKNALDKKKTILSIVCDVVKIAAGVLGLGIIIAGSSPLLVTGSLCVGIAANALPIAKLITDKFMEKEFNKPQLDKVIEQEINKPQLDKVIEKEINKPQLARA